MVDSKYVTVGGSTVIVDFDKDYRSVEICSLDGAAALSVAVDPEDGYLPLAYKKNGSWPIPATPCARVIKSHGHGLTRVFLISSGPSVSVCVVPIED